jgi:hypothetical protein
MYAHRPNDPYVLRQLMRLLYLVSLLVPRSLRGDWLREWQGEVRHRWRIVHLRKGAAAPALPSTAARERPRAAHPGSIPRSLCGENDRRSVITGVRVTASL